MKPNIFWQHYFLHMWPTFKARHFERIENGFKNESFALKPFLSKFEDLEIFVWFGFSPTSPNEHVLS